MTKQEVIRCLQTPYRPLLDYAFSFVYLSDAEYECVYGCYVRGRTEEQLAEDLNRSRDFVAKKKRTAIARLMKAWDACPETVKQAGEY